MRLLMLTLSVVLMLLSVSVVRAAAVDGQAVDRLTGAKGTLNKEENVYKVTFPRDDVKVNVDGVQMPPFMGLTSWAAFKPGMKEEAMVMGDLVLFQDEVNAAMSAAFDNGLTVTALHNHFFYDEPKVYFMHIGGEGGTEELAGGVRKVLDRVKEIRAANPQPARGFGGKPLPTSSTITAAPLAKIIGDAAGKPAEKDGMVKFTIGRTAKMPCGCEVGKEMGVNTWAAFYGSDGHAFVDGDFATFEGELQPVLKALRANNINVVAIHNHMEGETPKVIFLHYWGIGLLRSDDGNFTLRPVAQFQFRGVAASREGAPGGGSETDSGFEIRRMEFSIEGNAFAPKLTYEFKVITDRDGGGLELEDAWLQCEFADRWAVLFGQFRDPVFHEELVSSKYLLAVDRSLVNALLAAPTGFVQGVSLAYGDRATPLHAAAALHDGAGSINTPFFDSEGEPGFVEHFGVAARAEYKLMGDWKNYKDFTALGTKRDLLVLGTAADWTQGDGADVIFTTADAQWESATGVGLYAALLGTYYDLDEPGPTGGSRFDVGALVQGSYLFERGWEVFARYDVTKLDDDALVAGGEDTFSEITLGANRYLGRGGRFGHRAKFTFDVTYLPDGAPADATGLGILASDDAEWVVRGQSQLVL